MAIEEIRVARTEESIGPQDGNVYARNKALQSAGIGTSRTLRMDDLRFAIVNPPRKPGRIPRPAGCPASLSSGGQTPRTVPVSNLEVVGLPPESLSTLFRNHCPVSTGITVQFRPESVSSLLRNTQTEVPLFAALIGTMARSDCSNPFIIDSDYLLSSAAPVRRPGRIGALSGPLRGRTYVPGFLGRRGALAPSRKRAVGVAFGR